MNASLLGLLFTNDKKPLIYSVLWDISHKNNQGIPIKIDFFADLKDVLRLKEHLGNDSILPVLAADNASVEKILLTWSSDKKNLLKGLVIDLLCFGESLIKLECLAAQHFFEKVEIDDSLLHNIIKALP